VIAFEGDVDLDSSPAARAVLLDCVKRGGDLLIDLSQVPYMDSSGVASLVETFQASKSKGQQMSLVAVNPPVLRVLALARLDRVFPIFETVEAAQAAGGGGDGA